MPKILRSGSKKEKIAVVVVPAVDFPAAFVASVPNVAAAAAAIFPVAAVSAIFTDDVGGKRCRSRYRKAKS